MVVNIFKNGTNWLIARQQTILSAAFIIMVSTAGSLILGLIRQRLLASYFGQTIDLLEAYIAAARVPEVIFEVMILSGLSITFVPFFSKLRVEKGDEKVWEYVANLINLSLLTFFILAVFVFVFSHFLAVLVAPGKSDFVQNTIADLIKIMTIPQFFFIISVFLTGVLQSFQRFFFPALATIFYNLGIIFGIVWLSPTFGIFGPAWGMVIGAVFHSAIQLPLAYKFGLRFKFKFIFFDKTVSSTFQLLAPRVFGTAVARIADLVNISLASLISTGSVVAFNFSQILYFFPINLFAVSISQAALPSLSSEYSRNDMDRFKVTLLTSMHQMLFLVLPITVILAVLRIPVVRLVFGAANFPWDLTVLTGRTLIVFTIGLGAHAVSLLLVRAFYAIHDAKTPVIINIIGASLNILLSFVLIKILNLSVFYLAGAYVFSNLINSFMLLLFLDSKIGHFNKAKLLLPAIKILFASFLMGIGLYLPIKLLDQVVIDTTRTIGLIAITLIATLSGLTVYIVLTWLLKVKEVNLLILLVRKITLIKTGRVKKKVELEPPLPS